MIHQFESLERQNLSVSLVYLQGDRQSRDLKGGQSNVVGPTCKPLKNDSRILSNFQIGYCVFV